MNWKALVIKVYGKHHTAADTAKFIRRILGCDTPKDDHGHFYEKQGARCPHEKGKRNPANKPGKLHAGRKPTQQPKQQTKHQTTQQTNSQTSQLTEDQKKRVDEIVKALSARNPKINQAKQGQHVNAKAAAEATRKERAANPGVFKWAKSYFTVKMQAAHAMVLDRIRKGKYRIDNSRFGETRLLVDIDKPVGICYNRKDEKFKSKTIRIDYSSRDGYHIFPTGDDEP